MRILLNWLVNAIIIYFGSTQLGWVNVDSFTTALIVSLVAAILTWLIRLATKPLKVLGCLTFGVSYLAAVVLGLVAIPLGFYLTQELVSGFSITTMQNLILISLVISLVNSLVFSSEGNR
ncbi:MAG TPA: phage holin family protein [Tissierellia bacterium]|nr:phage holin family protein [Tissierellia bacterium]